MLITASNGKFLTAEQGGGINGDPDRGPARDDVLVANRTQADLDQYGDAWQQFDIVYNDDGTVSLRIGQWYVTAERGGGSFVSTDRTVNEAWQRFDQLGVEGGYTFRCADGIHYLQVKKGVQSFVDCAGVIGEPNIVFQIPEHEINAKCPDLVPSGHYLVDLSTGRRACLNGVDQFQALRMKLDGKDLKPLIKESQDHKAQVWRIFCQGSIHQNQMMDLWPQHEPSYDTALSELTQELNENGIIPLLECFVDNQDIKLTNEQWLRIHSVTAPFKKIVSGGNEYSKNGWDPYGLPTPPTSSPVWSRGSNVTEPAEPVDPRGAPAMSFHPRRDYPKVLDDSIASVNYLQFTRKWNAAMIMDEPPRMGTDGSGGDYLNPDICGELGAGYRVRCAVAIFHSRCGQRGVLMDEQTLQCFGAWTRGYLDGPHP